MSGETASSRGYCWASSTLKSAQLKSQFFIFCTAPDSDCVFCKSLGALFTHVTSTWCLIMKVMNFELTCVLYCFLLHLFEVVMHDSSEDNTMLISNLKHCHYGLCSLLVCRTRMECRAVVRHAIWINDQRVYDGTREEAENNVWEGKPAAFPRTGKYLVKRAWTIKNPGLDSLATHS